MKKKQHRCQIKTRGLRECGVCARESKKVDCVRLISTKHVKGLQHCHFEWKTFAISGFTSPHQFLTSIEYKVYNDDDHDDDNSSDRPPNYI